MLKLREIRTQKGISVPKLSEMTGLHRRTIQEMERRGECTISTAYKVATALGVTLNDIYEPSDNDASCTDNT